MVGRHSISLTLAVLFSLTRLTHQYAYSCNASADCGCSSNPVSMTRIVGGESAGTSTWGWAVSLSINSTYLCGGAILSSTWIITAAHCVTSVIASQITVYAGSNIRFSGQSRVGSLLVVHPSYNSATKENDIALLQVSSAFTMTDPNVKRICMASVSSSTLAVGEWPSAGSYVSVQFAICWPSEDNHRRCSFRSRLSDGAR